MRILVFLSAVMCLGCNSYVDTFGSSYEVQGNISVKETISFAVDSDFVRPFAYASEKVGDDYMLYILSSSSAFIYVYICQVASWLINLN